MIRATTVIDAHRLTMPDMACKGNGEGKVARSGKAIGEFSREIAEPDQTGRVLIFLARSNADEVGERADPF